MSPQIPIESINAPKIGVGGYVGFNPCTEILPRGWRHPEHADAKPITSEILVEHDVAIPMRDGITLYADILRPTGGENVPAILCWSPFGKKFNGIKSLGLMTPWNLGIPSGTLSGLEKFEAPDPADWVPAGYAIINIDSRGSGDSEGTMVIMGQQEAEDGYDAIEHVAKLPWCNGRVGLAGNSHLAIAQWFIAALQPPSLKAIAPWEGCGDLYREQFARGGIYAGDLFDNLIVKYMLQGRNGVESFRKMFEEHPLANAWWNDKRPDMKKIQVPTYITGTWTNTMHGMGAIRGWLEIPSQDKWLRWHPWQEWQAYLGPNNNIVLDQPLESNSSLRYDSQSDDHLEFMYTFQETTQLIGIPKAVLYMSCPDHDDLDVYVTIEKLDKDGKQMKNLNIPWGGIPANSFEDIRPNEETEVIAYKGPSGILRASHRAIDENKSMHPHWPFHPHDREEKIEPGSIVRLDIGIWAFGIEYERGESLRVVIGGRNRSISNFGKDHTNNKGKHILHFGSEYQSHLILPFV
ncbi:hypothetical protein V2G26_000263 [Clonostachys chloroleuca]